MEPETLPVPPTPEESAESPAAIPGPEAQGTRTVRNRIRYGLDILGKRRHFLVHKRSQLRATFMTSAVVLVLLVMLNFSLHSARERSSAAVLLDAPELGQMILAQNRVEMLLVMLASAIFLGGVFAVTLLETHKTAGAAWNVARHLGFIKNGQLSTRLRLRKDDNLQILEDAFNEMGAVLQERAWTDAEILEDLAAEVQRIGTPIEAEALAKRLREQSAWKRQMAG